MTPDCAYLLDNGRRCRCAASHDSLFCRHHSPEALARRNHIRAGQPASSSPSQPSRWDLRAYWRLVHAEMPHCRYEALQDNFEGVLDALAQRAISPCQRYSKNPQNRRMKNPQEEPSTGILASGGPGCCDWRDSWRYRSCTPMG